MNSSVISINQLRKIYPTFKLNDISFDVPKGYITGFIGPNGSGKTTTMKAMLSLLKGDNGEVTVFDNNLTDTRYLQKVGVVMDSAFLVKDWTMKDVNSAVSPFYDEWDESLFWSYLSRFKINQDLRVKELSRGMSVKLMLSIALSHNAELLILDEPTSGLDPVAREEICEILQEYVSDETKSVLFSTHITSDLESIADYIVFILNGSIVYSGTKDHLLESYVLIKGGMDDLKHLDETKLIGVKKQPLGFEAMAHGSDISPSDSLLIEPITLDQLIVFFNRGGYDGERS